MKLKNMKKEELEVFSYTDIASMLLQENKKSMSTADMFKTICELLELSEEDYTNQIGDYYISLTTDKRFILLDNAEWDLKDKHKVEINLEEDDDEDAFDEDLFDNEENSDELEEDIDESVEITDDEIDLDDTSDLEDLSIVVDDEMEEEM